MKSGASAECNQKNCIKLPGGGNVEQRLESRRPHGRLVSIQTKVDPLPGTFRTIREHDWGLAHAPGSCRRRVPRAVQAVLRGNMVVRSKYPPRDLFQVQGEKEEDH